MLTLDDYIGKCFKAKKITELYRQNNKEKYDFNNVGNLALFKADIVITVIDVIETYYGDQCRIHVHMFVDDQILICVLQECWNFSFIEQFDRVWEPIC